MPMIGLEIHGYLATEEKLFCTCKALHGLKNAAPNSQICPVCTAQPGAKPMLPNSEAVNKAIQISLILGCKINEKLTWNRKHYDWPDLPKGYQNTLSGSHATPVGEKGEFFGIKIREAHLEEDPAAWNPKTGEIDYNRSGSPLIEIVTEPDFTSSEQVIDWLEKLTTTLKYIKAIDRNAGVKADVNISVPEKKGARIEIKNINSLKNIKNALEYEIKFQTSTPSKVQETKMFDEAKCITKKMREKEHAEDYRFISDPDLPIMIIEKARIANIKSNLPETPHEKLKKIIKEHKIPKEHAEALIKKLDIIEFFENAIKHIRPELAAQWISKELLGVLNYNKKELQEVEIKVEHFVELLKLLEKRIITELKAKDILRSWIPKSSSPKAEAEKSSMISSDKELEKIIEKVIAENPNAVKDYKSGQQNALNFLLGKVMQATNKRADFNVAKGILERKLKK
jgi:aspartyl-tRNA(Asn)/glutamyl-tRNA(Gln) amidotransferase subunit B